jgi:NTP pyrophosphatase (non-canonical NTP hydrolase)
MDLDTYVHRRRFHGFYPAANSFAGLTYTVLAMAGEAGEVANRLKKVIRDDGSVLTDKAKQDLVLELGDVLWYICAIADELKVPMTEILQENYWKIRNRQENRNVG